MKTFEDCRRNNAIVANGIKCGYSMEQIIVHLCQHQETLILKIMEQDCITPKRIRVDGKDLIWRCPAESIPV